MSEYEGCYVKLAGDPTYWLVEDGERQVMASPEEVYAHGLKPVKTVSAEELAEIPIKRKRRARPKAKATEPKPEESKSDE